MEHLIQFHSDQSLNIAGNHSKVVISGSASIPAPIVDIAIDNERVVDIASESSSEEDLDFEVIEEEDETNPAKVEPEVKRNTSQCKFCKKTFCKASVARRHERSIHLGIARKQETRDSWKHWCDICQKPFPRPNRLKIHMHNVHNIRESF